MMLYQFKPGFISKEDVKGVPIVGLIAKQIGSLFVSRSDEASRNVIVYISLNI